MQSRFMIDEIEASRTVSRNVSTTHCNLTRVSSQSAPRVKLCRIRSGELIESATPREVIWSDPASRWRELAFSKSFVHVAHYVAARLGADSLKGNTSSRATPTRNGGFTLKEEPPPSALNPRPCLSVNSCLPQGRRRDRIILCRFSCFPVLRVVYALQVQAALRAVHELANLELARHPRQQLPLLVVFEHTYSP